MLKIIIETSHLSNHRVNAVSQYSQVINGTKVPQQKSVDCIEYIFHRSVHGPKRRSEKVPVPMIGY